MPKSNKLWVYGTLRYGHVNHWVLRDARLLGPAITKNERWSLMTYANFPALIDGHSRVQGELYEVDDNIMKYVDHLESVLYRRVDVPVTPIGTWWDEGPPPEEIEAIAYKWAQDVPSGYHTRGIRTNEANGALYWDGA